MSRKVKESLFELIKALTKSEKRYFKLMSSRHTIGEENNYVILFDFIDRQVEYDENEIFKYFKGKAFLNKFSITKKRLYDQILNALDAFHKSNSLDAQLYQLINSAEILYNKSLYDQAKTILRSAEKIAEKNNLFSIMLIIQKKQKKLIENESYESFSEEQIQMILEKDLQIQTKSINYDKVWYYKSKLFQLLSSKGNLVTENYLKTFKREFDELVEKIDQTDRYFEITYLIHHVYSAYYFAVLDYENCFDHLTINVSLFENDEVKKMEFSNKYFSLLTNSIFVAEKLHQFKASTQFFNQLKFFQNKLKNEGNQDLLIKLFSSVNSIELNTLINRGEFKQALKIIPSIESQMELYNEKLAAPRKMYLAFKIAVVYIAVKDFSNALKWVNFILNHQQFDQNESIFSHTQLLNVLIHYEMGHDELLNYLIKNTQRFLKSKKRYGGFEIKLFNLLNKLTKEKEVVEQNKMWLDFYEILKSSDKDAFLDYFDLLSWVSSKSNQKSFEEVVKMNFALKEKKAITV